LAGLTHSAREARDARGGQRAGRIDQRPRLAHGHRLLGPPQLLGARLPGAHGHRHLVLPEPELSRRGRHARDAGLRAPRPRGQRGAASGAGAGFGLSDSSRVYHQAEAMNSAWKGRRTQFNAPAPSLAPNSGTLWSATWRLAGNTAINSAMVDQAASRRV